jgi:hypothetical protein
MRSLLLFFDTPDPWTDPADAVVLSRLDLADLRRLGPLLSRDDRGRLYRPELVALGTMGPDRRARLVNLVSPPRVAATPVPTADPAAA